MSYLSPWPSLDLRLLWREDQERPLPFPFGASGSVLASRARNLIYHLFRELAPRGARVLVPDYHHGAEIDAIRAAGATLLPYRIGHDLQPDLDQLAALCATRPRALFLIHYFGWPQPIDVIAGLCRAHDIRLVEDCALSLLSATGDRPLGSFGDFAVFCLHKTLAVPDGAILVQNGERLPGLERACTKSGTTLAVGGRMLDLVLRRLRARAPHAARAMATTKYLARRTLDAAGMRRGVIEGSAFDASTAELSISRVSKTLLRKFDYEAIRDARRRNFALLEMLSSPDEREGQSALDPGICPLFFPVLAGRKNKREAAELLRRRGVGVVELWNEGARWLGSDTPAVRLLREHALELPIHQDLGQREILYLAGQIRALGLLPLPLGNARASAVSERGTPARAQS